MGSPDLNEITLHVTYGSDGVPSAVRYVDQEGCGHESKPFGMGARALDLVNYHLRHAAVSHHIHPKRMCEFAVQTSLGELLHCLHEKHDHDTPHRFEVSGW